MLPKDGKYDTPDKIILHSIGRIFGDEIDRDNQICIHNFTNNNFFKSTSNVSGEVKVKAEAIVIESKNKSQTDFVRCLNKKNKKIVIDITDKKEFDDKIGSMCVKYKKQNNDGSEHDLGKKLTEKIKKNNYRHATLDREQQISHAKNQETENMTEKLKMFVHNRNDDAKVNILYSEHYFNNITPIELYRYANIRKTFSDEKYKISEVNLYDLLVNFNIYISGMFFFREYVNFMHPYSSDFPYHPVLNAKSQDKGGDIKTEPNVINISVGVHRVLRDIIRSRNQYYITDGESFLIISFTEFIKIMRCLKMEVQKLRIMIKDKFGNILYNGISEDNKKQNTPTDLIVQLILARDLNIFEYFEISTGLRDKKKIETLKSILSLCEKYYVINFYDTHKANMFFGTIEIDYIDYIDYIKNKISSYEISEFVKDLHLEEMEQFNKKISRDILDNLRGMVQILS